jgi:hypothetical protein
MGFDVGLGKVFHAPAAVKVVVPIPQTIKKIMLMLRDYNEGVPMCVI